MKTFKRILASLMVAVMVLTCAPMSGFAGLELPNVFDVFASAVSYSGTCGYNLTWTFNTETGALTIDGTGAMYDYSYYSPPWESYEDAITSVTIGNSVATIGRYAFYDCDSLIDVTIGTSVTTIGDWAFEDCTSLTNVTIPDSVTKIEYAAFAYCTSLTSVTIPDSVTTIGDYAFTFCASLTSVTIPDSVTTIGIWAFGGCNLTSVTIPDSVTTIGDNAFAFCASLTSAIIGNNVTTIGDGAFYDCDSLTDVYYNGTEEQWNKIAIGTDDGTLLNATIHYKAGTCGDNLTWTFNTETGVLTIDGTGKMTNYDASNPAPWDEYKDQIKKIIVSDGVTTIGNDAFIGCGNLEEVTLPEGLTKIGKGAFMGCDSLFDAVYKGTDEQWAEVTVGENNEILIEAMRKVVLGDVNNDGKINSFDALLCLDHSVEKTELKGKDFSAADTNCDGKVNSMDALMILEFSVGKIEKF